MYNIFLQVTIYVHLKNLNETSLKVSSVIRIILIKHVTGLPHKFKRKINVKKERNKGRGEKRKKQIISSFLIWL